MKKKNIKYFYNGNLKFEGEYLNGKRHGKGKEYNNDGNIVFEGEYLYGNKKEGKEMEKAKNIMIMMAN